ncbi:MAG: hypothetical protein A4E66_00608 [Syntrophus sp. PtaB.Bin001]|nr:MAG: hypothetical protein A4E66_00608 [Syntrophus sp. PtaB.Bin001]
MNTSCSGESVIEQAALAWLDILVNIVISGAEITIAAKQIFDAERIAGRIL